MMPNGQLIALRQKLVETQEMLARAREEIADVRRFTQILSDSLIDDLLHSSAENQLGLAKIIVDHVKNKRSPLLIEANEILRNPVRKVQKSDPFLALKTVVVN